MPTRLGAALGIEHPSETYLADVDPGFYCAAYLRAWALETHLRRYLQERFGPAWFAVARRPAPRYGRCGQRASADPPRSSSTA